MAVAGHQAAILAEQQIAALTDSAELADARALRAAAVALGQKPQTPHQRRKGHRRQGNLRLCQAEAPKVESTQPAFVLLLVVAAKLPGPQAPALRVLALQVDSN
jgi:hypothetical protein